ncbi:hypothetical protein D9611_000660 [Ephemerocybe angulata]|uniref:Uncharacterized protein n=1 Tax=Ephemerocybe angulata TaxID=980116 RepID=A0A8H5F6R2_9AGAR|nr:hypothetical protein D9611_000660 [Tulosesus angulatus]
MPAKRRQGMRGGDDGQYMRTRAMEEGGGDGREDDGMIPYKLCATADVDPALIRRASGVIADKRPRPVGFPRHNRGHTGTHPRCLCERTHLHLRRRTHPKASAASCSLR